MSSLPTPQSSTLSPTSTTESAQAPNRLTTWSTNQRERPVASERPTLEQTVMELQPNPLSAMELIRNEPIRIVHGRKAVCDGG
jgi:NADH dehydrogenase (ubiquinone) Fe-S protein 6